VEAEDREGCRVTMTEDAKDAALLMQLVVVGKGQGGQVTHIQASSQMRSVRLAKETIDMIRSIAWTRRDSACPVAAIDQPLHAAGVESRTLSGCVGGSASIGRCSGIGRLCWRLPFVRRLAFVA